MYEVNINASPDDFLDWDKPLSEQSEKVRGLYNDYGAGDSVYPYEDKWIAKGADDGWSFHDTEDDARQSLLTRMNGEKFYRATSGLSGSGDASGLMKEAGIPGIRYLDQGSRGAGGGSHNYVVFDEKLISILRKYGLLGAAGLGGAAYTAGQDDRS
jgi:hypothetical protein